MTALQPQSPWRDSYESTAQAIAKVAEESPLFGDSSGEKTAALMVAVAWYESRFKPDAKSSDGQTSCLFQVDKRYFDDEKEAMRDPELCTRTAASIMKRSLAKCAWRPEDERLAAFTSGNCEHGRDASRYRSFLGGKLLREHPVVYPRVEAQVVAPMQVVRSGRRSARRSS